MLDQDFHINADMGEFQRRRLGSHGVGFTVQFLNQEVESFAELAALVQQLFHFVEVGAQPREFFGDVNADGKGGGFGQGPVVYRFGQGGAVRQGHGLFPAVQKALALLGHQLRHQGLGLGGQTAQLVQVAAQHGDQALAFALACGQQLLQRRIGQVQDVGAPVVGNRVLVAGQAQYVGDAQWGGQRQPGLHVVLHAIEALQQFGTGVGNAGSVRVFERGAQFNFAAPYLFNDSFAQRWLQMAEFVWKTKGKIQESAVDGPDFKSQAGRGGRGFAVGIGAAGAAVLNTGIAGHAVNWHGGFSLRGNGCENNLNTHLTDSFMSQFMSKAKPAPLPPETMIGGYRVIRRVAAGGFGLVYLAEDADGQQVAIKEYLPSALATRAPGALLPQVQPDKLSLYRLGLKSFFEEGRSLAQISHPSVVSVLNFFRENETVYMVMNYLQGAALQDFIVTARDLKQNKVFRESTVRSLFDEILRGLRIVHQHKMLHLDIKPANIFITDDNKSVLIDFGAAREVLNKESNYIRPMYTPGFAPPEMYRRDVPMGPWTDIYAIGACMYACMQGYPPSEAPQRKDQDRSAVALARLRGVYSDNLIDVVAWCMSMDPQARPQTVFALQKELSREGERSYTKLTVAEKLRMRFDNLVAESRKSFALPSKAAKSK